MRFATLVKTMPAASAPFTASASVVRFSDPARRAKSANTTPISGALIMMSSTKTHANQPPTPADVSN